MTLLYGGWLMLMSKSPGCSCTCKVASDGIVLALDPHDSLPIKLDGVVKTR